MKLSSLMTRHPVRRPGDLTPTSHFKAGEYMLDFEAGIVTIASDKGTTLVPVANVQDMVPAAAVKK